LKKCVEGSETSGEDNFNKERINKKELSR